jgi:hypothetical protein
VRRAAGLLAVAVLGTALAAQAADLRRIESVGVVPVAAGAAKTGGHRNSAVRAGVARAVESVALSLGPNVPTAPEAGAETPAKDPTALAPELARALGSDPLDYAASYRIVDDRGLRKALYERQTGAGDEYVVVVEVQVDAARIAERLRTAGWLAAPEGSSAPLRVVLEGVSDYRAYESVRRLLVGRGGARSVQPVEFRRGRAVLAVAGAPEPAALVAALQANAPPELRLIPLETEPEGLTLLVEWTPPPEEPPPTSPEAVGVD